MKIFVCILFFTLTLLANSTSINEKKLTHIIHYGWNDKNVTLNNEIILFGKTKFPKLIKLLTTPVEKDKRSSLGNTPTFLLHRKDYLMIFSYSKYLQNEGDINEVYSLYIEALRGIKNIKNLESFSLVHIVFASVIENIISDSLNQSLLQKVFTQEKLKELEKNLPMVLILDNEFFLKGLNRERIFMLGIVDRIELEDKKFESFYKNYCKGEVDKEYKRLSASYKSNKMPEALSLKETTLFDKIAIYFLEIKIKIYDFLSLANSDKEYQKLANYLASDFIIITTPSFDIVYEEYISRVEVNKRLLKRLKGLLKE